MVKVEQTKPGTYWQGKCPCWVLRDCIAEVRAECQAFHDQSRPCWEYDTPCKELLGVPTCLYCEVWKRYAGAGQESE
jgi:hypothetical protein